VSLMRQIGGGTPETVTTVTLNDANHWSGMVTGLPAWYNGEAIAYSWTEPAIGAGYTLTGNVTNGILTTLTNSRETEKTAVNVTKVWVDGDGASRPESIQVQLFADGEAEGAPVTLSAANGWSAGWSGLNKYAAGETGRREIAYTVEELGVPEGYESSITGSAAAGYTITNTLRAGALEITKTFALEPLPEEEEPRQETIEIPVVKIWQDNDNRDGNRPQSITVHLYAGGEEVGTATLNEAGGWRYTFTDLPRYTEDGENEIAYSIREDPVEWYVGEVNGFTITNVYNPELTSVSVRKIWDDNDNAAGRRPLSIVMLLSNGMSVTLNEENNWSATITDLPTRVNGEPVTYTWKEQSVLGYTLTSVSTSGTVTTFTNSLWQRPELENGDEPPKTPGTVLYVFEEYETPLGVEVMINHVGDCFD